MTIAAAALVGLLGALVVVAVRRDEPVRLTPLRVGAEADLDVASADASPRNRLDVYVPADAGGPRPAVVYLHPGGWAHFDF